MTSIHAQSRNNELPKSRTRTLLVLLGLSAVTLFISRLPATLQFDSFAFFDTGENLTLQYLITHGYRPFVDFSFIYGLAPLSLGRVWFSVFGATPLACVAVIPLADALIIWALVRFARATRLSNSGMLLLLATTPYVIPSSYLLLVHVIEPVLIIHALASQSAGNRRLALTLVTSCIFVKPSMAYVYGLLLLILITIDLWRKDLFFKRLLHELYPATFTGLIIAGVLLVTFGWEPTLSSLLPVSGMKIYRAQHFGLFYGNGRSFWYPPGAQWKYYFTSIASFWLAGTLALVAATLVTTYWAYYGRNLDSSGARLYEIIWTCCLLHIAFITFFFGNQYSAIYYFYILILGLAAASQIMRAWQYLVGALAIAAPLALVNKRLMLHFRPTRQSAAIITTGETALASSPPTPNAGLTYGLWFSTCRYPDMGGLWAPPAEREEWARVRTAITGQRAAILDWYGAAELLLPQFLPPVTLNISPGAASSIDLERKIDQLGNASVIVMPRWQSSLLNSYPAIGTIVRREFVEQWSGERFTIYMRRSTAPCPSR